ncbi:MAG: type II toxin-antitoxin system HipA family toxin [Deltaproteobacteria bacterium]|nr:type II toxin-antitoxin system HipA family toxin [Deltaproteobacteria bacterium]
MGPRSRDTERLGVYMNGVPVGRLIREGTGALSFTYAPSWLEREKPLPISRRLPLTEKPIVGKPVRDYFDNLLPDDPRIREKIAARARASGTQAYDLLAAVGRDCVGALQFYPDDTEPGPVGPVHGKPLTAKKIAEIIRNLRINPLGINPESDFRISLAGVQNKTALLWKDEKWLLPEGPTPTTHIIKPQIGRIPNGPDLSLSVENEWLCLRLLRAYGMAAAEAEMVDFEELRVLVVKRFDREWSGGKLYRLPQEDMCQALGFGTEMKYESDGGPGIGSILRLLNESDRRDEDRGTFLKAQIVYWLLAAIDGHAKNFSIFIRPGGGFVLTPLYDVMSADPHINPGSFPLQKIKLAMAAGDHRHFKVREIRSRHWRQTANKYKFSEIDGLIEEVIRLTPLAIEKVRGELPKGFPTAVSEPVFAALAERARTLATP